jgi:hypothetical protein
MNDSFSQGNLKYSILNEDPASKTGTVSVSRNRGEPKDRIGTTLNISPSIEHNGIIYTITRIESEAFYGCASLTCIMIPESVTSIGWSAFRGCTSLASITIPEGVTRIDDRAFSECSNLTNINVGQENEKYRSVDGVLFTKDMTTLIAYPHGKKEEKYKIPECVSRIGNRAFQGCKDVVGITIPDSLTSIGDVAFDGCRSLACITIPEGVTRIGIRAFDGCENLKDVYFKGAPLEMHNGTFKIDTVFHYVEGTPGWTTPRWKGFRTYIWKPEE